MAARNTDTLPIHANDAGVLMLHSSTSRYRSFIAVAYSDNMASANWHLQKKQDTFIVVIVLAGVATILQSR